MSDDFAIRVVGIWWCEREDYSALRDIFTDGDKLPERFERWLEQAERAENNFRTDGVIVERAYLKPDKFSAWCFSEGLDPDTNARMKFAADLANSKHATH